MKRKVRSFSTVILFQDLPTSGYLKEQCQPSRYFTAGEIEWKIEWYPAGEEQASEGFCSLYLHQKRLVNLTIQVCCTLLKDGKAIDMFHGSHTYSDTDGWGWMDFAKIDDLLGGKISLKLEIMSWGHHIQRSGLQRFKEIVQSLDKDVQVVSGKVELWANSAVLRQSSPVFGAMLNLEHGFRESKEKSINLEEGCEKFLKEFLNFLHEGEVEDLEIREEAHYPKFYALITLADKYQVDSLLEYILFKLSNDPTELDILNRLRLVSKFKHATNFKDAGESLMMWANQNLGQPEFLELTKKIIFTTRGNEF